MQYTQLDPPALLTDFMTANQRKDWSKLVSSYFDAGVAFNAGFSGVTSQFYHPVRMETDEPHEEPVIDWPGFPKLVKDRFLTNPEQAWRTAETGPNARAWYMDEYLEWHVARNAQGKITRVSFTCETTQYYGFLASTDRAKLLAIYKDLVDPAFRDQVGIEDLIANGKYQPLNKWNTEHGAIHLIQPNNNLYAEVMIAAQACILRRRPDGTIITDSDELIACAGYGARGRASDPKIGAIVNEKAREGYSIALRNPVALYITQWGSRGWKKPDGSPVGNYWRLLRGKAAPSPNRAAMGLHLIYEVPPTEGFVVGDIQIGTRNIQYGGQIAENISVGLFALLCRKGRSHNPAFGCDDTPAGGPTVLGGAASAVAEAEFAEMPALRGPRIADE